MVDDSPPQHGPSWVGEQDKAQFAMAIQRLREHLDQGKRLPLYYTLPTGRSIEALCDRLAHSAGPIPSELVPTLHFLAGALSIQKPDAPDYRTYAPVVKEIAARLALPNGRNRCVSRIALRRRKDRKPL